MLRTAFRLRAAMQQRTAARLARSFASYPPHEVIGLPSLSPTMETGNMSKWITKEGDAISAGDVVCEIETDKAVVDYEATDDMFLAKILIPEGTENVPVGQPMMVVCDEEESIAAFKDFKLEDGPTVSAGGELPKAADTPAKEEEVMSSTISEPVAATSPTTNETKAGPSISAASVAPLPKAVTRAASAGAVFENKWGLGIKKSAISTSLIKRQQAYIALYGITGMTPAELLSTK
ncbi:unnamed protein product [Hyaloperonospora brassicae]|uniref:Lipoyl-binding domain-containing protein n=1 Tax=Hyaloperonospora brassicae TaxID=162125 RepID=A0AAV0UZX3_HYABA|nr:unnamed protein product [Hyaloperonospora brassicae]